MLQTALERLVWFLKASAEENRMHSELCCRSSRWTVYSIPGSSSTTRIWFRPCKYDIPDLSADTSKNPIRAVGGQVFCDGEFGARRPRATESAQGGNNHPENGSAYVTSTIV